MSGPVTTVWPDHLPVRQDQIPAEVALRAAADVRKIDPPGAGAVIQAD